MSADDRSLAISDCASPANPYSDGGIKLALAQQTDRRIVHIAEVSARSSLRLCVPGDQGRRSQRGPLKRHHFSHRSARQCRHATETVAPQGRKSRPAQSRRAGARARHHPSRGMGWPSSETCEAILLAVRALPGSRISRTNTVGRDASSAILSSPAGRRRASRERRPRHDPQ
jgi:hypothetical protein